VIEDRETPGARLTPIEPPNPVLGIVPATRSVAQVMEMLRSAQRQPLLQPGVLDKAIKENKRDLYDKLGAVSRARPAERQRRRSRRRPPSPPDSPPRP
jgi:hypothetical protein